VIPIVAVVGRPNVGKSTLFNRLVGGSLAIVDDQPGVTRDRHYAVAHLYGRNVTLVDTGGFDPESDDPMQQGIARHVKAAIATGTMTLDSVQTPAAIDAKLTELETAARQDGFAIGVASAYPVTIARMAEWAANAGARGFHLVPVSAFAGGPADLAKAPQAQKAAATSKR